MRKVVYTCITGNYDSMVEPDFISEGFDYICFTDDKELKSNIWKIVQLGDMPEELTSVKKQRYVKICPHKFLPDYDLSIWVDGNVKIIGDMNKYLETYCNRNTSIFIPSHPQRECIYSEANTCIAIGKDRKENVKPQIDRYEEEGFPKNYGLVQSNIIIRKHNEPDCIELMDLWWSEVRDNSHRDQLSFNYALWKLPHINITNLSFKTCNADYFTCKWQHKNSKLEPITPPQTKQRTPYNISNKAAMQAPDTTSIDYLINNLNKIAKRREKAKRRFISFYSH